VQKNEKIAKNTPGKLLTEKIEIGIKGDVSEWSE
jgi:hypothetical protein